MQDHTDKDEPPTRILAELSALADGTLEPSREAALQCRFGEAGSQPVELDAMRGLLEDISRQSGGH